MVAEANERRAAIPMVIWGAVAALGWFVFRQLSLEWSINPQYSYGWVVPALAIYLVVERWRDRPAASVASRGAVWFTFALILLWPVRLIQEANPDWRLVSWVLALLVVSILWCGVAAVGGVAWWRHFAFALGFIIVAVPWPTPLENLVVQSLMRGVAAIAAEILNWFGMAAQQSGNLIQLPNGTLGVDEACSGVRSLQGTLMAALFLGEMYRLRVAKRVYLIAAGILLGVALNIVRATFLAWSATKSGVEAVGRWHDPAGYFLLIVTFIALLMVARAMRTKLMLDMPTTNAQVRSWPRHGASAVIVWLLFYEVTTLAWYKSHEREDAKLAQWWVEWPAQTPNFVKAKISENVQLTLRFNEGESAIWNRPDGSRWHLFFFVWKPGRAAASLARNHRPETCLPATGFTWLQNRGAQTIHADGVDLPFERIDFAKAGQRLHAYYCLWEDRAQRHAQSELLTRENRLRAVIEGRRHLGQRVMEVVIAGIDSSERADAAFGDAVKDWIRIHR